MAQIKHLPPTDNYSETGISRRIDSVFLTTTEDMRPMCYQTDERYLCSGKCKWESSCKTLMAEWLRRN